jgi:uncharacterized protein (TIGR04222 family)
MGWLFDNVLANMPGPDFLMFYATFACVVLVAAYVFIAMQDTTGDRPPPPIQGAVDPYELAFLRGGINEIIRTAVYSLRQQGLIEIVEQTSIRATGFSAGELTAIERAVLDALAPAPKIAALFADKNLRERLERLCGAYERRLSAEQLLKPPEMRRAARLALIVAGGLVIALAAYKLAAAAMHGRSNVGFLCIEAAVAFIAMIWIFQWAKRGNASKRGKAFLAQVQRAYSGHLGAVSGAATESAPAGAVIGGSALLMVGLFGFGILKGTPDAALAQAFAQSSGSGDGGGGSCGGGGDGGGGGGCGGCGGGGGD